MMSWHSLCLNCQNWCDLCLKNSSILTYRNIHLCIIGQKLILQHQQTHLPFGVEFRCLTTLRNFPSLFPIQMQQESRDSSTCTRSQNKQMDVGRDEWNSFLVWSRRLSHNITHHPKCTLMVTVKSTSTIEWEESYLSLQSTRESTVDAGATTQEGGRALFWSLACKACSDTTGMEW